ncbi:hypothetical protein A259_27389, partial [Pseudomonas syringae pv. actinidiae ICMP 19070]
LEAYQRACCFAHGGGLSSRHTRKARLGETAELAHAQAQSGLAGELDGSVPKAHVARDRQARTRLGPGFLSKLITASVRLWMKPTDRSPRRRVNVGMLKARG